MVFSKKYFEEYARISVAYLLNFNLENLICDECPDIQSKMHDIGVEVTVSEDEYHGFYRSLVNKYFGKKITGTEIVKAINDGNKKQKFKGQVILVNEDICISPSKGMVNTSIYTDWIINSIRKKSIKSHNYKKFDVNALYCFSSSSFIDDKDEKIIAICEISSFDKVFIHCLDRILIWDKSYGIKIINISVALQAEWKEKARSCVLANN